MTSMQMMPRGTDDWTVDDLEHLPDDGLRYELVDGMLLDPVPPSIVVFELDQGSFVEVARGAGDAPVQLSRPYPVVVTPADLVTA